MSADEGTDVAAIRAIVATQFACMNWSAIRDADWATFRSLFLPSALLYPAARPAVPRTVDEFVARMEHLRTSGSLATFDEKMLGCDVSIFGNVAIAFAGCEMRENGVTVTRDVSGFLFVKSEGRWLIAAQGWDLERPELPLPVHILHRQAP